MAKIVRYLIPFLLIASAAFAAAPAKNYDQGTAAEITAGTDTEGKLWSAKDLADSFAGASAEVVDEAVSQANFESDTSHAASQAALYTYLVSLDTGLDGDIDSFDATAFAAAETDPIVGAITGLVKADGGGNISAAVADTDYQDVLAEGAFADGDKTKLNTYPSDGSALGSSTAIGITAGDSYSNFSTSADDDTINELMAALDTALGSIAAGVDAFTVKVDAGATAGYLGAANSDGVLRTDGTIVTYADGGDYVTIGVHAYLADIAGITAAQGDVIYFDGSDWVKLAAGTDGYFLKTQGAAANPVWAAPPGGGDITAVGDCANGDCFVDGSSSTTLTFEGTDNAYETLLTAVDPTVDATVTIPNETGTIVVGPSAFGTDNRLIKTNGTGVLTQITGITVDDSQNVTGIAALTATGAVTGATVTDGTVTLAGDGTITGLTTFDGEIIADDTIDDDSIDFSDVTLADLTFDVGSVDTTEFGYLNGVTSAIQTQLDGRALESVVGESLNSDDLELDGTALQLAAEIPHTDVNETVTGNWTFSGTIAANGEITMGADFNLNANEIQSTGNIVFQLGDNAGSNKFSIQDSDGVEQFYINSNGGMGVTAINNPYYFFNDDDMATEFAIRSVDTTTDHLAIGTTTDAMASNFTELGYFDVNHIHYDGNINITTGHTYQINDVQIALANLSDGNSHGSIHIQGGSGEIDGDLIDIDYAESNYTPATTGVATDVNHLAAHLEGIDNALGALGGGTLLGLTDVGGSDVYTSGYILIADGDSYDPKAVGGDATLASDGTVTIANDAVTFAKIDDDGNFGPFTGAWDFTGGSLELNNSDDPDLTAVGQIALDTDGWLRVYNGAIQYGKPLTETIHVTVVSPNDLADGTRDAFVVWKNTSGMSFVITHWYGESDTDDTTLNLEETDADGANNATVDAVEIATDGTGMYYADDGTITAATIEDGHRLLIDFDDTDDPGQVKITIVGYYNGDVN